MTTQDTIDARQHCLTTSQNLNNQHLKYAFHTKFNKVFDLTFVLLGNETVFLFVLIITFIVCESIQLLLILTIYLRNYRVHLYIFLDLVKI